ncbi:MAG: UvrD-helicase domain-containing protein [Candidatus Krumholzibacteriia bacterium]|nr:UvrD-helicase domain-containing protein [Candidatus Latescibacterota bacterium]
MSVNPWQELERELNARQREAVFSAAPHCLVLAGPGTGKTRTLVNRVVYLVSAAGVAPAQILTLTFTRKAARVMVERLARYLGESAGGVRTGTFHHFCLELLRRRAGHGEIPPDFSVADEPRQLRTLERAWNRLGVSARPPEERELRAMLGRFGAYRVARDPELLSGLQREFFAEYQRLLREERAIDFDDILDLARVLLESDAPLLAETRERWPRVLVDEFQDTDALQYRLLRLLAPPAASSFVVADDQQSIYAWRGADRRNVERYRADYAPHEVHLEENYRNREAILAGAQAVLGAGGEAGHTLVSRAGGEGSLRLEAFASEQEEADFLVADMRRARARDRHLGWGDIAILYPKHSIGEYLETRLMAERVPVELVAGRALLAQERIRRTVAVLRLLRHGGDDEALSTLLAAQLDEGSYALLRQVARGSGDSLRAAVDRVLRGGSLLRERRRAWQRFQERLAAAPGDDSAWLAAWDATFPDGLALGAALEGPAPEAETAADPVARRRHLEAGAERMVHLSRLPWLLEGVVARLGNLRAGQSGRSLSQLVREILLEFADPDEEELPGDPAAVPGLAALLAALREALRRGRPVRVDVPGSPAAAQVLTEMLRAGLEPWHAQCLAVANPAADAATPSAGLRLVAEGDRLALEGGPAATGAPWALLAFRLYQLWRGAEHRPLRDFVLFDLETTGVDTASCEVIELAAIRVEGGRPTAQFEALVKPVGPIPAASTAVHGIDARTVADAPPLGHVLPDFLTFLGEHDLVAHNGAAFDFPVLRRVAREQGLAPPRNALFDSVALARRLHPGAKNDLGSLIARYGVTATARHRALDDCRCLLEVLGHLQDEHLAALRRRAGREALAPAALALQLAGQSGGLAPGGDAATLFQAGVRRLLAGGNPWLDRLELDGEARQSLEAQLLAAAGLEGEAPDLFTGLRSEEERFLSLVPRFDELFLGDSLAAFLDFLALYTGPDLAGGGNAVQLMTIHAAKGLEFERVYITGLEENVLPGFYALRSGDPEELAEERRLLYVAMTRAARALTLTRVGSRGGFQQSPSRFLAPLGAADGASP